MEQQVKDNLELLFANLNVYYNEELRNLSEKIKYLNKELSNITNISKREDVYNISLIVEELIFLTSNLFNSKLLIKSKKINKLISELLSLNDYRMFFPIIKQISLDLIEYNNEITIFFNEKLSRLKNGIDIENFMLSLKNCEEIAYDWNNAINFSLKQAYINHLDGKITLESLIDLYKSYFLDLKKFVKNNITINDQLPLNKNPIISLLQLAYFIRTQGIFPKYFCDSDLIFLDAYTQVSGNQEYSKLIELHTKASFYQEKYENLDTILQNDEKFKKTLEYGIFSVSQYFLDFDINKLLSPEVKEIKASNRINFSDITKDLLEMPALVISVEDIYSKISKNQNFYTTFIGEEYNDIKSYNPSTILFNLANIYFQKNIKIATYINTIISGQNDKIYSIFLKFEDSFNNIASFVKKKEAIDSTQFKKYLEDAIGFLNKLDAFYEQSQDFENKIFDQVREGNLAALDKIRNSYKLKNYKTIVSSTATNKTNIDKELEKIEELIKAAKYEKANVKAKELTIIKIEESYYSIPKLISIYDLPPISHEIANYLVQNYKENNIDISSVSHVIELNEEYWRI